MSKRSSARRVAVGAMVAVLAIMVRNAAGGGEGVFRVSGWPAEFPSGCQGAMRGVTVRIEPLGREYRTDVADGRFAFEAVSPGNYTLSVSPSCNPFGCWPEMPVSVVDDDVFVRICPVEQTPTPTPTPQPTPFIGPIEISCELRVDPPVPVVGDHVRVTVQQRSTRLGYPSYSLDPNPLFAGSTREQSTSTFELDAVQAGMTTLSGSTRDEFVVGYVNDAPFFSFYGASCTAPVEVLADGPTPTPTPTTATPTFTPTSCVSDEPTVEEVPASVHSLRRTLTGFDRGLYCFRSGSISIDGAGVLALEVDCGSGRYTAEILLTQPDATNAVTVCHHPGGCGSVACTTVEISHQSARFFRVDTPSDGADQVPGDGTCATAQGACTLRAAIQEVNASPPDEAARIRLPRGVYTLAPGGDDENAAASGDLDITADVSIAGADAVPVSIEGSRDNGGASGGAGTGALQRVFDVRPSGALLLCDVTVRGGRSRVGAGIANAGFLSLDRVVLTDNVAGVPDGSGGSGGGLWNRGQAVLLNVSIDQNHADAIDGIGTSSGGGIWNDGRMRITSSTISGNRAAKAGGVFNAGSVELMNVTVSGNTACCQGAGSRGGGILNEEGLTLRHVTMAANFAVGGGSGLFGIASVYNSILADNPPDRTPGQTDNCSSPGSYSYSGGFNIDSDGSCQLAATGDRVVDPLLQPLRDDGGITRTHALQPGSPALDAAGPENCPATDQRGVPRPLDGNGDATAACDVGAFG